MNVTSQATLSGATIAMAHVFPSFGYGGQQARFAALAGALGNSFRHDVISLDGDLSARALIPAHVQVSFREINIGTSFLSGIVNYSRFRTLLKELRPDILCTYNWGAMEAVFANWFHKLSPHVHFEDGFGSDEAHGAQLQRRVIARRWLLASSHIVVPSSGLERAAKNIWRVAPSRLHHIQNGIDFTRFQQPPSTLGATVMIGSVGALRPEKNYLRLIRTFAQADRDGNAHLTIVGDGPERERLLQGVKGCCVEARVLLPGATQSPEDALRDIDIFALSSDTEQAPLTVMEAMASGLPVVATNVGDIADMVSEENRAFITSCGDDTAYVEALSHLIQNPDARAVIGAANRKKARAEFDLPQMVDKYCDLFSAMLR